MAEGLAGIYSRVILCLRLASQTNVPYAFPETLSYWTSRNHISHLAAMRAP